MVVDDVCVVRVMVVVVDDVDGCDVGSADGCKVGCLVGRADGAAVGIKVGALVGDATGLCVGARVGTVVGATVSAHVHMAKGPAENAYNASLSASNCCSHAVVGVLRDTPGVNIPLPMCTWVWFGFCGYLFEICGH